MATFNAGGLASGMDTNAIVDALVKVRSLTIDRLKAKQGAFTTQVSAMGDIVARMNGLKTAATGLSTSGALGLSVSGTLTGLAATPSAGAQAGRYAVEVVNLAAAAKQRSGPFTAASPALAAGNLDINVAGTVTTVAVAGGATLADVAASINQQVTGVSASVLSDGTSSYLSITNRETGYPLTGVPADALQLSGTAAAQFGFTEAVPAENAHVKVDGLDFYRRSNAPGDVIPGVSLALSKEGPAQDLVLVNDTAGTAKNVQGFLDAYNLVLKSVQKQLQVSSTTDRTTTLAGDAALRTLQQSLQGLTSRTVGSGTVRTLADIGVKTARDGSLSIDSATLEKAIARDASGVNALFNTAATGISAVTTDLTDRYTNATDGMLTVRTKSIQSQSSRLAKEITEQQADVERYRELLVQQFTAMEKIVGQLKSTGNFLTSQERVNDK